MTLSLEMARERGAITIERTAIGLRSKSTSSCVTRDCVPKAFDRYDRTWLTVTASRAMRLSEMPSGIAIATKTRSRRTAAWPPDAKSRIGVAASAAIERNKLTKCLAIRYTVVASNSATL